MKFILALSTLCLGITATPFNPGHHNPAVQPYSDTTRDDTQSQALPTSMSVVERDIFKRSIEPPIVSVTPGGQLRRGSRVHKPEDWIRTWGSLYVPNMFKYDFRDIGDGSPEADRFRDLMHKYPDMVFEDDPNVVQGPAVAQGPDVAATARQITAEPAAPPTISAIASSTVPSIINMASNGALNTTAVPLFSVATPAPAATTAAAAAPPPPPQIITVAAPPPPPPPPPPAAQVVAVAAPPAPPAQIIIVTAPPAPAPQALTTTVPLFTFLTKTVPGPAITKPAIRVTTTAPGKIVTFTLNPGPYTKTLSITTGVETLTVTEQAVAAPTPVKPTQTLKYVNPAHNHKIWPHHKTTKDDLRKAAAAKAAKNGEVVPDPAGGVWSLKEFDKLQDKEEPKKETKEEKKEREVREKAKKKQEEKEKKEREKERKKQEKIENEEKKKKEKERKKQEKKENEEKKKKEKQEKKEREAKEKEEKKERKAKEKKEKERRKSRLATMYTYTPTGTGNFSYPMTVPVRPVPPPKASATLTAAP